MVYTSFLLEVDYVRSVDTCYYLALDIHAARQLRRPLEARFLGEWLDSSYPRSMLPSILN